MGIVEGDVPYYYVTNLQGDVVGIVRHTGQRVVTYTYDAWGNVLSITGSKASTLGVVNPIRYRGYVYDQETGLYYVSSRYHNPEVGRWISPEPNVYEGGFDEGAGLFGYNLYTYCANNPVNMIDINGEFVISIGVPLAVLAVIAGLLVIPLIITPPVVKRGWVQMCNGVANTVSWAATQVKSIAQAVTKSFAKAALRSPYRSKIEIHHIVAKKASNATRAREVLESVGIGINSAYNLVPIKTGLHRRLHTNAYYGWANSVIISAYNKGRNYTEQRQNVLSALGRIRTVILTMDATAPY